MLKNHMASANCIILDDNEITSYLITQFLNDIGNFSCQVFSFAEQLLQEVKHVEPDFIFINVMMKDHAIRKLTCSDEIPTQKIIFISDLDKKEERRRCYLDNSQPYISSPLSTDLIREGIYKL